jgi:hypothetical protein
MSSFGLDLMMLFLEQVVPDLGERDTEFGQWSDLQEALFDGMRHMAALAKAAGREWDTTAPIRLDRWLVTMAETGQFTGAISVPPDLLEELSRRWTWSFMVASMEDARVGRLDLPIPAGLAADAKGWAAVLFMLGGPGREYRLDALPKV